MRWSHEGRDEGLLELDFREPGQCEIVFFGVTAKLVGTGAGRWLMNRALELAWSRPVERVWLHTCTFDHPAALAFYQRSGFRPFRRQVEVVDDPRLDGTAPRECGEACAGHRVKRASAPSIVITGLERGDPRLPVSLRGGKDVDVPGTPLRGV